MLVFEQFFYDLAHYEGISPNMIPIDSLFTKFDLRWELKIHN